jgi:DNA helicase II / ATP-dependent DNA helicase PcrA
VTHILGFKKDWPDAKIVRLEINYRSTREIVEWANRLIAFNRRRHAKTLKAIPSGEPPRILQCEDEVKEAKAVVDEIAERIAGGKRHPKDFAILCRTNEQPRSFEMELRRAKIPYVLMGGMSFYDRKEVRDILAYLKMLANPRDEASMLRIINNPPRGIGQATVKKLLEEAVAGGKPLWEILSGTGLKAIDGFRGLVERYRKRFEKEPLAEVVRQLIHDIRYRDELIRLYPDADEQQARWAAVEEMVNAAGNYAKRAEEPTLAGFLHEVALTGNEQETDKESRLERDAVVLMTLHSAKGLEFPEVYMVGMEEGLLPHVRSIAGDESAIDEERRLCYVGVTRAKRRLTLTLALGRMKWGKSKPTIPSRFLYELTGKADNPNYLAAKQGKTAPRRPAARPPAKQ